MSVSTKNILLLDQRGTFIGTGADLLPAAGILFSSSVSIEGHVSVVPLPASIFFSGNISISGTVTCKTAPLNISVASSGITIDAGARINLSPAGITANSGATVKQLSSNFLLPPGQISLGNPGIAIDGFKTIIPVSPGQIAASTPEMYVAVANMPLVFVIKGNIDTQLPQLSFDAFAGEYSINAQFPLLSMDIYAGERLSVSMPSFQMEGELSPGNVADADIQIPSLRLEAFCGNQILATIPFFGIEMEATYNYPVDFIASMPSFTMLFEAGSENLAALASSMPAMCLVLESISNNGDISCILPNPDISASLLSGITGTFSEDMPLFRLKVQSIVTGDNDMVITLCSPQLQIQSGEIESNVLRYVKGRIR